MGVCPVGCRRLAKNYLRRSADCFWMPQHARQRACCGLAGGCFPHATHKLARRRSWYWRRRLGLRRSRRPTARSGRGGGTENPSYDKDKSGFAVPLSDVGVFGMCRPPCSHPAHRQDGALTDRK
jgi:hypothetical protein